MPGNHPTTCHGLYRKALELVIQPYDEPDPRKMIVYGSPSRLNPTPEHLKLSDIIWFYGSDDELDELSVLSDYFNNI